MWHNTIINIDEEIAIINKIIKEAAIYGGDAGGPYLSNPEDLIFYLNEWLSYRGINKNYYVFIDEYNWIEIRKVGC